jgi:hypothetical protein
MAAAQSEPVQVTDTFGTIEHFTPQELTTLVTLGSGQETDQVDALRRPVTSRLATYPPFHSLAAFHVALIAGSPDGGVDVGDGVGVAVVVGVAVGVEVGVAVVVGDGVGDGTGTVTTGAPVRIGARAASFSASGVRQSLVTSPPVMPELGLKDQYA